jgi:hypothetical protein
MPTVTGAQLLAQVRSIADEPDDGSGPKAYITDSEIYLWLSDHYRAAIRGMARGGYPYAYTREDFATPGASVTLAQDALAIRGVYVTRGTSTTQLPRLNQNEELYSLTGTVSGYWQPAITTAGAFTINLYPDEDTYTVRVYYIPEPADLTSASSLHLPGSVRRCVVLGAALDCYAKRDKVNQMLLTRYQQAEADAELEATHYAEQTVTNTDTTYRPGDSTVYDYANYLDFGVYLVP